MADLLGGSPNLLDDLFKELEDWETILNALPDLNVVDLKLPGSAENALADRLCSTGQPLWKRRGYWTPGSSAKSWPRF